MFVTDMLIGIAYVGISLTLLVLVKKIKIPFTVVVLCFGVFIAACGATHFMEVWTLWKPDYWVSAGVKTVTAIASVGTGIYLYQLRHPIITVAEAAKLSEQRRLDLEALTKTLEQRVEERAKELRGKEAQLRVITDAVPAFIAHINRHFQFTFANKTYREWFGEHVGPGTYVQDIVTPEAYAELKPHLDSAIKGNEELFDVDLLHPKLGKRTIAARYIPEPGLNGSANGLFVLAYDITDQRNTEKALLEAVHSRDEFISIASHELKTPVTPLKLQSQMLERTIQKGATTLDAKSVEKVVRVSTRQIDRLTRLVEDMLDISRIATRKLTTEMSDVELSELVNEVTERLSGILKSANCELRLDVEQGVIGHWDQFRVEQVLDNLITNAVKYGPGKPIEIRAKKENDKSVTISVRDHGPGIAKEDQERIFERFERAIPAENVSGLGLGLYIVREILKTHGGSIRVESELEKGATFIIDLPLHPSQYRGDQVAA